MSAEGPAEGCAKAGCPEPGRWSVILDAADGSMNWRACREHAEAFRAWVINETERQGRHWATVEVEYDAG